MGHGFALYDVFGQTPHIQETSYQKCLLSCPGVAGCRIFSPQRIFHKCLATQKFDEKRWQSLFAELQEKPCNNTTQSWINRLRKCIERRTANFRFCGEKGTPHSKVRKRKSDETNMINRSGKRKQKSSCEKCNEKGKYWKGLLNERCEETKETLGLKGK